MNLYGFFLEKGENIEYKAKISKAAIIAIWAVIPAVCLLTFLTAYLPVIIRCAAENQLRERIFAELGISELGFASVRDALYLMIFSALPTAVVKFISGFALTMIILLVAAWFVWACVYTHMNTRYALIITDRRIFAKVKDKVFVSKAEDVLNVDVAQSLFGKIFNYGEIHIQTKRDAVTLCNIANAKSVENILWAKADKQI